MCNVSRRMTNRILRLKVITTIPVLTLLERQPEATPIKYTSITYTYKFSMWNFNGDMMPTIMAYAQRGWMFKGMIALPAGMKDVSGNGMSVGRGLEMKVMLFFAENNTVNKPCP